MMQEDGAGGWCRRMMQEEDAGGGCRRMMQEDDGWMMVMEDDAGEI